MPATSFRIAVLFGILEVVLVFVGSSNLFGTPPRPIIVWPRPDGWDLICVISCFCSTICSWRFFLPCDCIVQEVLKPCIEVTVKCSWIARNRTYDQNGMLPCSYVHYLCCWSVLDYGLFPAKCASYLVFVATACCYFYLDWVHHGKTAVVLCLLGTCANLRMLSSLERSCIFKHVVPLILAGTYTAAIWTDNFPISWENRREIGVQLWPLGTLAFTFGGWSFHKDLYFC